MPSVRAYGSWSSPITAEAVAASSPRLDGARFVGDDIWWGESVPAEAGRTTVRRRRPDGSIDEVLPKPWSAGSRVHEYGGGSWTASDDGILWFVEKSDQGVWELAPGAAPRLITPADSDMRFGGLSLQQGRLLAIRETHSPTRAPARDIVEISTGRVPEVRTLAEESDFLAHPMLSPGGHHLAWIAWNHPDMPWDRTQLRVGRLEDGEVVEWAAVAGGETAPLQPVWTSAEDLLYADDPSGRWNLWHLHLSAALPRDEVAPADADTGGALWVLGTRWFRPLEDGRIVAVRTNGGDALVLVEPRRGETAGAVVALPVDVAGNTSIEDARGSRVLVTAAGVDGPPALWLVDVDDPARVERIVGGPASWGPQWMPRPREVTYDGPHGPVHAIDYPPRNPDVVAPPSELPPYVVFVHGGPTSHVAAAASSKIAYFTSRGIGVLDVNYGGSTGYGRAYRERLRGQWGVVDVDDVAAAASGLAAEGRADPARLAIEGGSAGGWTVLAALTDTDVFAAGISRYGVGDARALAADTHDFEARYLDGLIGQLPEAEDVYVQRSPLSRPDRFRMPVLLLQGADDPVVPVAQSEAIRDALAERGVPHAYVLYPGEGHGFRRRETMIDAFEKELAFLGAVFGFETPGVPPLELQ